MFGEETETGDSPAGESPEPGKQVDTAPPTVKVRGRGGFVQKGKAKDAVAAEQAKEDNQHALALKRIELDEARRRDEHELKRELQAATIKDQQEESKARRDFRYWGFVLPLGVVTLLAILDVSVQLCSNLPAEKIASIDGVIRFVLGWASGLVTINFTNPSGSKQEKPAA